MSALTDLLTASPTQLTGNKGLNFIDADTLQDEDNNLYRIRGFDAPEVAKYFPKDGEARFKSGTAGGQESTKVISNLANELGFTNMVKLGEKDATGNRDMVDLQNEKGESFTSKLLEAGVFDTTGYSTQEDQLSAVLGDYTRARQKLDDTPVDDEWALAKQGIEAAISAEGGKKDKIKKTAFNEAELVRATLQGRGHEYNSNIVDVRDRGRDLDNWSNNPFSDSFDQGLLSAKESLYGFLEMTGVPQIEEIGEAGVARARSYMESQPEVLTSYDDIEGFWGKKGAVNFVLNNAAISLPYMAATVGSVAATPLVGPSIVGLAATPLVLSPAMLYSGQVWNEMEGDNRNAGVALGAGLTQAVLDRVGLKGLLSGGDILTKQGRQKVVNELMKRSPQLSETAAQSYVANMTKEVLAETAGDAAKFAKDQLGARNFGRALLHRVGTGAATEGATEALQEAIGYTAANYANGFETWDAHEFNDRLIQGIAAGSALGGSISTGLAVSDYGAWADVAFRKAPSTERNRAKQADDIDADITEFGHQINQQARNEQIAEEVKTAPKGALLNERIARDANAPDNRTLTERGRDIIGSIPSFFQRYANTIFDDNLQESSRTARWMGEAFGANNQRTTSGSTYENRKHHLVTKYKNIPEHATKVLRSIGFLNPNAIVGNPRTTFSKMFYEVYQNALKKAKADGRYEVDWKNDVDWDQRVDLSAEGNMISSFIGGRRINRDTLPALRDYEAEMRKFAAGLKRLQRTLHRDQKKLKDIGYIHDYLFKYKAFNKTEIEADKDNFTRLLIQQYNMSAKEARRITDAIIGQNSISDIDDAFLATQGPFSLTKASKFNPSAHKKRAMGLSENPKFAKYMQNDVFANMAEASKSAARFVALEEYVGADQSKINYQLDTIQKELEDAGWTPEAAQSRVDRLAKDMQDYLDVESGNFKRIENDVLRGIQENLIFYSAIISLPLSTISNFVELPMINRGLTAEQIMGKGNTSIKSIAENMGKSFIRGWTAEGRRLGVEGAVDQFTGYKAAKDLGFFEWEVGAAHTTGVIQIGSWKRQFLDQYFRLNQLQGWTNMVRSARAGIADDYITNHLEKLEGQRIDPETKLPIEETKEQYQAREALRNLGIDPDYLLQYKDFLAADKRHPDAAVDDRIKLMMQDARFNFVNEAIALPQSGNRPRIFQDPRFALFTQFQGFISTFTANHIPRMWSEYVKRGSPSMRYQAFALVTTMILMGFLSQYLKDYLKYGGPSPYLEDVDYYRRGLASSGWLGTGERVIDFAFPIYESRYQNPLDWAVGTVSGESAAITKATRVGSLGLKIFDEQDPTTFKDVVKLSPFSQSLYSAGTSKTTQERFENVGTGIGELYDEYKTILSP